MAEVEVRVRRNNQIDMAGNTVIAYAGQRGKLGGEIIDELCASGIELLRPSSWWKTQLLTQRWSTLSIVMVTAANN